MTKRNITLKDLSKSLNLSISTVSRALKDHHDISTSTKAKVQQLARELNYVPNHAAQSLRSSKTKTIGVIIPNLLLDMSTKILNGMIHRSRKAGYRLIISESGHSYELEKDILHNLIQTGVDGILLSLTNNTRDIEHVIQALETCPIVLYDKVSDKIPCTKVIIDDEVGAYNAVKHLIDIGRKDILYINGPNHSFTAKKRFNGYKKALAEHHIPFREALIKQCKKVSIEEGEILTNAALRENLKFDAIFGVTDNAAIGAIKALKKQGVCIPKEVAVIGFSNSKHTTIIEPNLSSIEQPGYDIGKYAVEYLLEELRQNELNEQRVRIIPKTLELKTELKVRASSET